MIYPINNSRPHPHISIPSSSQQLATADSHSPAPSPYGFELTTPTFDLDALSPWSSYPDSRHLDSTSRPRSLSDSYHEPEPGPASLPVPQIFRSTSQRSALPIAFPRLVKSEQASSSSLPLPSSSRPPFAFLVSPPFDNEV